MAGYLKKYIGTYRVKADYDLSKNDIPKIKEGDKYIIDPSFDDYYIKCEHGIKIRHYGGKILLAYIPSIGRGRNKLKQIYKDYIGDYESLTNKQIYDDLKNNGIVTYIDETDYEIEFRFKAKDIDYFAKLLNAQTSGCKISPHSVKNLPKTNLKTYDIPMEDLALYKEIIKDIPQGDTLRIGRVTNRFNDIISTKKGKAYDIKAEQRLAMLKGKEFIYSIGLWNEYIEFLRINLNNEV